MMASSQLSSTLIFLTATAFASAQSIEWPVYFEKLGSVHSIHNKWDLALRVEINLPSLDVKLSKVESRLAALGTDFRDPEFEKLRSNHARLHPSRLDELNRSWRDQNKHLRSRLHNIQRRSSDLRELGDHVTPKRKRRETKNSPGENSFRANRENGRATLSRSKRQSVGQGLLQAMFGVAYTGDVEGVKSQINRIDQRLSGDINGVRSSSVNFRSTAENMLKHHTSELNKVEKMAQKMERKVGQGRGFLFEKISSFHP